MAISSLPAGFRFHPTDIELVMYYLKRKVMGKKFHVEAISELNIYQFSPWDLPDKSCLKSKDREWYFFCPREKKYASGPRMNRATETGFWKTTGKDRIVSYNDRVVGRVKTLIFHEGNAPHGNRTDWVLHEYRLEDKSLVDSGVVQDSFVLCKVFQKSGPGPKNGAQYGAPFQEEEWDDDVAFIPTLPCGTTSPIPEMNNISLATGLAPSGSGHTPLIVETPQSQVQSSSNNRHHNCQKYTLAVDTVDPWSASGLSLADVGVEASGPVVNDQFIDEADDIAHLLSAFADDDVLPPNENRNIQNLGSGNNEPPAPQLIGRDSFNGLQYLHNLGHGIDAPANHFRFDQSNLIQQNVVPFLEIADIDASFVSTVEFSGPEPSSGGLYEPYRPFGPEHNMLFTGLSNADNTSTHQIGQPFGYGTSFGPQPSYHPILNELPALPNLFDGLVPQTAIGYDNDFPQGVGSAEQQLYPASNSRLRNIGGDEEIQKSGSSRFL